MFNATPFKLADAGFDPKAVVRSARDLPMPDAAAIVRRADLPRRVDAAMDVAGTAVDAATTAVHDALQQLPGRRRRRSRRPFVIAGILAMLAASAGVAAWWARRAASAAAREAAIEDAQLQLDQAALDREALDRAAGEGMADPAGATDDTPAVATDGIPVFSPTPSNGLVREPAFIGDLA